MAVNMAITKKTKNTRRTGDIGERIAQKYLKERGYTIIETNYLKNWGELDIVAQIGVVIHVIEVKTHTFDSKDALNRSRDGDNWQPEEQVHGRKLHQIEKALQTWIVENDWEGEYQIDVIAVKMVPAVRYATVKHIKNVVYG